MLLGALVRSWGQPFREAQAPGRVSRSPGLQMIESGILPDLDPPA
jgi:hypothetical protein